MSSPSIATETRPSLGELALVFFKLGTTAFGGPAAHIAMMHDEFVRRRRWISEEEFLDRLGAANLIPGPSSTEMAIHIGLLKRGWRGLLVAGACFIVPAAILVSIIAAIYVKYGALPRVAGVLVAVKPVVIAIIVQAFWNLGKTALKSWWLGVVGALAAVAYVFRTHELLILLGAALLASLPMWGKRAKSAAVLWVGAIPAAAGIAVPISLSRLFLTFLKIGSVLFGSGYVLLAFLRGDFVDRLHWLTQQQLLDAVAVGQITPGPVFTTATFIGYIIAGTRGAAVATVAIFLPAFFLVAISGPLVPRIRKSKIASAALDGVVVASLALMGVVAWQLGRDAIVNWQTVAIALVSALLLLRWKVNSAWLILGAAAIGVIWHG
ncbi:Chromate transporter [Candidatus Koribacter versatilis Ellin345]|uniref:Chromate transporter n=1 Tax=Koribacter versatilis (strain Ellin345) TaxID=204669 RepID=Q1IS27_KORVE|nr:chromate efflux transporter [Candidatus Koribacter versatilis]ABF40323.1 Chromate transporter [Candidatus Koribacter versatilis Ellin345]